jgi:hypothetical protein
MKYFLTLAMSFLLTVSAGNAASLPECNKSMTKEEGIEVRVLLGK